MNFAKLFVACLASVVYTSCIWVCVLFYVEVIPSHPSMIVPWAAIVWGGVAICAGILKLIVDGWGEK
jgi:hypothetical protein